MGNRFAEWWYGSAGACQHSKDLEVPLVFWTGIVFHGDPTGVDLQI